MLAWPLVGCAAVPKETVSLSKTIVKDLQLHASNFLNAERGLIEAKRAEVLLQIQKQELGILSWVDQTYENVKNAGAILTGYLELIQKIKASQDAALAM